MKSSILLVLFLAGLATCHPEAILDFEGEDHQHEQEGQPGNKVEGYYSWTSPEGEEFYVRYVADEDGYRVVESNAVPRTADGVAADGNQGSFSSEEDGGDEGGISDEN